MRNYQYGEIFNLLGVPGMGHQGATWCAPGPDGVLILMSHQNYFGRNENGIGLKYELPHEDPMPPRAPPAAKSLRMIEEYFQPDKPILLPVAVFVTDGGLRPDGTFEASVFRHATGDVYRAKMVEFHPETAHLLCDVLEKYSV